MYQITPFLTSCKHQYPVDNKYNLIQHNLLPYLNYKDRYLFSIIALGRDKAAAETFDANSKEKTQVQEVLVNEASPLTTPPSNEDDDSGRDSLDILVGLMEEHHELTGEVTQLCNSFIGDGSERMKQIDIQYLLAF